METMHAAGRRRLPPVPRPAGDRPSTGQLTVERPTPETAEPAVAEPTTGNVAVATAPPEADSDQTDTELIDTRQIAAELIEAELAAAGGASRAGVEVDADDDQPEAPAEDAASDADTAQLDLPAPAAGDTTGEDPAEEPAEEPAGEAPVLDSAALDSAVLENLLLPGPADEQDPAQQFVARLRSSAADFAGAAGADSAVVREAVPPARHRRARCRLVLRYADGTEIDVTLLGPAGRPGRPSRHGFDRQILRWLGAGLVRDESWLTDDPDAPDGVAVDLTAWVTAG
ncbi:hypothetical protein GCM10010531_07460 [Blastococcus jejuensis]|uniref:Regulatory protein n=1 Tax=Blastococcus jejuensis TaxID=351224 RepID=A0ABP6NW16_9ACTN